MLNFNKYWILSVVS